MGKCIDLSNVGIYVSLFLDALCALVEKKTSSEIHACETFTGFAAVVSLLISIKFRNRHLCNVQRAHEKVSDLRGDVFDTIKSQLKVAVDVGIGILLISSGFF